MITLDEIKADINSGKCKAIYLSDKFLWWTHLESDMDEATKQGIEFSNHNTGLLKLNSVVRIIACDPVGGKIIINKDPGLFIAQTLMNPRHYGKHKLKAFMRAHHQNCNNYFSNTWAGYNNQIDKELKK